MHFITTATCSVVKTPFGAISLVVLDKDVPVVIGAAFGKSDVLNRKVSTKYQGQKIRGGKTPSRISDLIAQWADGNLTVLNKIKVQQNGSPFQQECWAAMRAIKPGTTLSYAELAQETSSPGAVRAAATCCAINLVAPIIPCHRIIKSDGSLGNYGFGTSLKKKLLIHEGFIA